MSENIKSKQKLVKSAYDIFSELGYVKTRISDIVEHASLAQGTFYLYFQNKQDCFNYIIAERFKIFFNELTTLIREAGSQALFYGPQKTVESIREHQGIIRLMYLEQNVISVEWFKKFHKHYENILNAYVRIFMERGESERLARIKVNLISNLLDGVIMNEVVSPFPRDFGHYENVDVVLESIVYGLKD